MTNHADVGRLQGRRALVTGGGSGIGRATALRLAREGAAVAIIDVRPDSAEETAAAVAAIGVLAHAFAADVGEEHQLGAAVRKAIESMGGLDLVVASAGIARTGITHQLTLHDWETTIRVNLTGTFLTIKHSLPALIESERSSIVTIGSVASLVAAGGVSAYDASKGGVLQFTKAVAVEYVDQGVRANCVCPGVVSTGLRANTASLHGAQPAVDKGPEPSLRLRIPMDRRAHPDEIASVVAFLSSDDASFITGAAIAADGGYTAI